MSRRPTANQQIEAYFAQLGWSIFPFQRAAWRAYAKGCSGLVHSATGTGKTLAVWLGPLLSWLRRNPRQEAWNPRKPPPLQVLWITPLRALAVDTVDALQAPLDALGLPWRLEARTGDSKASLKARQLKRLPTALVTTPESLSLMLSHAHLQEQLAGLEAVIVDEWHELLGNKRGIQAELALARLRSLNPQLRTWGVSATLGNLEEARDALMGTASGQEVRLIRGYRNKKLSLEALIPRKMERFPWAGHIGQQMAPQVAALLDGVASALVFVNTRSQSEIWYQRLLQERPHWAGELALHHGSLDSSVRAWVEDNLREGRLRAVVCTSSLDLGVDFSAVDLVVQVGSPKGAARLLQRAGRSGHQPGAISRLAFVPTNALELAELAACQQAIRDGHLEARRLLEKPLDVLAQHLVTLAIGGGFQAEPLLREVRSADAYRTLSEVEWQWVLDFIVRGGSTLQAYPDFRRVVVEDGWYRVSERRTATRHRLNIGTIVADAAMQVKYLKGGRLGSVEEQFLARLKPGDRFLIAGKLVSLVRIRDNVAYVRRATGAPDSVPRWLGGRLPLSSKLSAALRVKMEEAAKERLQGPEMRALAPLFQIQRRWSALPHRDELLMERIAARGGHQLFLFPFEGRLVHEGLAALLALRLSRLQRTTFTLACNDYGLVLQSHLKVDLEAALAQGLLHSANLLEDILESMNATEMAKRQFRQIARVAGLLQSGYPGQRKSARHLQASSNLFFDVFQRYDPDNLLLEQSRREVLQQQLEVSRLMTALQRMEQSRALITTPPRVTPLAFPLLVDKLRERLSSETLAERIRRMQQQLEHAAQEK